MIPINWTAKAIKSLRPNAQFVLRGTNLKWLDNPQPRPTDAEIAAEVARLKTRVDIPNSVSPLQIRRALREMGLLDEVTAYIGTMGDEAKEAWEYAVQIDRDDPLILAAASALRKSPAEVDAIFVLAASL